MSPEVIVAVIGGLFAVIAGAITGFIELRKVMQSKVGPPAPPSLDEFSRIIESYDRLVDNLELEQKRLRETLNENDVTIKELRKRITIMRGLLDKAKVNWEEHF